MRNIKNFVVNNVHHVFFFIRHGESEANVDTSKIIIFEKLIFFFFLFLLSIALYSRMADHQIELTKSGHEQAVEAGEKLRQLIGKESMYVYMSPYLRSRQTWENIKKAFSSSQIITERHDPRLREQEFGNIADLATQRSQALRMNKNVLENFFIVFHVVKVVLMFMIVHHLFLDTLFREMDNGHHDPTQNIVIVSHELFMRLF